MTELTKRLNVIVRRMIKEGRLIRDAVYSARRELGLPLDGVAHPPEKVDGHSALCSLCTPGMRQFRPFP